MSALGIRDVSPSAGSLASAYDAHKVGALAGAILAFVVLCLLAGFAGYKCKARQVEKKKRRAVQQRNMQERQEQHDLSGVDYPYSDQAHDNAPYALQNGINEGLPNQLSASELQMQLLQSMMGLSNKKESPDAEEPMQRLGKPPKPREEGFRAFF